MHCPKLGKILENSQTWNVKFYFDTKFDPPNIIKILEKKTFIIFINKTVIISGFMQSHINIPYCECGLPSHFYVLQL